MLLLKITFYESPKPITWRFNWTICQSSDINTIYWRYKLTLTLKMTTAQVVETSVTVTNSSSQNYTHPDDHTRQTKFESVEENIAEGNHGFHYGSATRQINRLWTYFCSPALSISRTFLATNENQLPQPCSPNSLNEPLGCHHSKQGRWLLLTVLLYSSCWFGGALNETHEKRIANLELVARSKCPHFWSPSFGCHKAPQTRLE